MMKEIETSLHKIKMAFEKNHDAREANEKLEAIPARIKKAVARLKADEEAGTMYKTHERTLNRKLKGLRMYIKNHEKKSKKSSSRE